MPLKLSYFDIPGRGELIRLALSYGKVAFEDARVGADWPKIKPTTPLGQMPVLELEDGSVYCQSIALARYAARITDLYPTAALEALKVDMYMETMREAHTVYAEIKWGTKDEDAKAEKTKVFLDTTLPKLFGFLETKVQGKFFLGDKPTLADLEMFDMVVNNFIPLFKDIGMPKYPKLEGVVKNVKELPTIAAYLAK